MRKQLFAVGLVLLNGIGSGNLLSACGDKIVRIARGTSSEQAPRRRQETVLIYTDPASGVPAALARVSVDATLRKVGYRPTTVATSAEFERELSQGGWDLILVDLADVQAVRRRTQNKAAILPVALKASKAELKQTEKQFRVVLHEAPRTNNDFVHLIDDALASRSKGKAA